MPPRQQPRRIARELALLSLSQIKGNPEKLEQTVLNDLILASIRTLVAEVHETLETASAEVKRGEERLLSSDTRAIDVKSARAMVQEALELTQTAINRLGTVTDIPELVQLSSQYEVRQYALEIISTVHRRKQEIEAELKAVMVDWQLNRLAKIDRDILLIATAEILFLDTPPKVAINEAVEMAKRYSDQDGYRFVNGVLRKVSDRLKTKAES
jgi:N utilization substance protein B